LIFRKDIDNRRKKSFFFGLFIIAWSLFLYYAGDGEYVYIWGHPVPVSICVIQFILGIILIIYAFLMDTSIKYTDKICVDCKQVQLAVSIKNTICTNCSGNLEDIKGILKKHPELLNKKKS